jgi:hypothetical protein
MYAMGMCPLCVMRNDYFCTHACYEKYWPTHELMREKQYDAYNTGDEDAWLRRRQGGGEGEPRQ